MYCERLARKNAFQSAKLKWLIFYRDLCILLQSVYFTMRFEGIFWAGSHHEKQSESLRLH